jgi:hypothetical protein
MTNTVRQLFIQGRDFWGAKKGISEKCKKKQ